MSIEASYRDLPDTAMYYKARAGDRITAVIQNPGDPTLRVENVRIQIFADKGAEVALRTADGRSFNCKVPLVELKEEPPVVPADPDQAVEVYLGRRVFPEPTCCEKLRRASGKLVERAANMTEKVANTTKNGIAAAAHYAPPLYRGALSTVSVLAWTGYYASEILLKAACGALHVSGKVSGAILEQVGNNFVYDVRVLQENCPVLLGAAAAGAYYVCTSRD